MKIFGAFSLVVLTSLSVQAQSTSWKITQTSWTETHERQFGEFVTSIGMAVEKRLCGKVDECLQSSANPYYKSDPAGLKYFADCADLPYYLRSYFAWKNGLPMSVISEVKAKPAPSIETNPTNDVRYSSSGNYVTKRYDVLPRISKGKVVYQNALHILNNTIPDYTFSASYRMPGVNEESLASDFYPTAISREAIRPGTVIYDPNGHVAIVYRVADDGRIFYIDAHPDNSLTRGMFTPKFVRSKPGQGAGFKNFRPLKLVNAKKDAAGNFYGGQLIASSNSEIPFYGTSQFYGSQPDSSGSWNKGKFSINGQNVSFYDYVRMKLMVGEVHIDPLSDMAQLTDDICVSLKDRVDAVEAARRNGIDKKEHPMRLPENIYGTSGEWEDYSSPSRDARLKVAFQDLLATTKSNIERYNKRDPAIKYNGGNLAQDLLVVYAERAKACTFSYTTSAGKTVMMNLEAGRQRLWDMSFDPYHCIELRWGARVAGELASCQDDANKRAWYAAEKWLRYQSERKYDARMDYSLNELKGPLPSAGVASPEDIDIVGYLKSMR